MLQCVFSTDFVKKRGKTQLVVFSFLMSSLTGQDMQSNSKGSCWTFFKQTLLFSQSGGFPRRTCSEQDSHSLSHHLHLSPKS